MNIEQLKSVVDHANFRIAEGEGVSALLVGLSTPLRAYKLNVNDEDDTLDIWTTNRSSLYRIAREHVLGFKFDIDEDD